MALVRDPLGLQGERVTLAAKLHVPARAPALPLVAQKRLLHDLLDLFLDEALVVLESRGVLPQTNIDEN